MTTFTELVGSAALTREMDGKAIVDYGIPGIVLMENAGRGAFEMIMAEFEPRRAAVFCGKGNNGGDGYVIARHLLNAGVEVHAFILSKRTEIKGDAKTNLEVLYKMGAHIHEALGMDRLDDARYEIAKCDLIVDAILGTGVTGEVTGFYGSVIRFINQLREENPTIKVFAVDLPSGLDADTGQVQGAAVQADATATFGLLKQGQFCFPGAELIGTLAVIDISMPSELYKDVPHRLITAETARGLLPERPEDCHKGIAGHGLVLAGSPGKTGAAVMAAESALRIGAGLVTLAGPESLHQIFEIKTLEVMTEALPEAGGAVLGKKSAARALELMAGKTAAALGPGIGRGPEVTAFVKEIVTKSEVPLVIDADGLNAVAEDVKVLKKAKCPVILTPHPGEMARLMGVTTEKVMADRFGAALTFAKKHGAIVALKGAHSLIGMPDGRALINLSGNPGMATGGAGDVLTGAILGLICQGLSPIEAAALGVFLHGMAGDLAAEEIGEEGVIARDIMDRLSPAMEALRGEWEE